MNIDADGDEKPQAARGKGLTDEEEAFVDQRAKVMGGYEFLIYHQGRCDDERGRRKGRNHRSCGRWRSPEAQLPNCLFDLRASGNERRLPVGVRARTSVARRARMIRRSISQRS